MTTAPTDSESTQDADAVGIRSSALFADFCGWTQIFVASTSETCEFLNVAAVVGQDTQSAVTPMRSGASELSGRVGCEARLSQCLNSGGQTTPGVLRPKNLTPSPSRASPSTRWDTATSAVPRATPSKASTTVFAPSTPEGWGTTVPSSLWAKPPTGGGWSAVGRSPASPAMAVWRTSPRWPSPCPTAWRRGFGSSLKSFSLSPGWASHSAARGTATLRRSRASEITGAPSPASTRGWQSRSASQAAASPRNTICRKALATAVRSTTTDPRRSNLARVSVSSANTNTNTHTRNQSEP